ncbi:hypothetical protein BT96DRAFT_999921 [Gymnopus androsaceus JB14]|uniref:Arrestin C-terminal-like domain-containing protein n=1 Tax=Gymnopus androsaceus JB14 TaxID=1447944 RepID=A0A6A4H450_9AGAR|nr:hypothetical protein BT96DRAFT_999921 [Gymnopus androsaceus JB14]
MDTSSIISSALSARSSRSKPSNNINNSDSSHAGPSKNTLSIRLAESAVFLRTNDSTGRNRYNDSRPTMLRGLLTLELVKPTRINRIVLELAAKSITVWPEGTHGRDVPLTESHKVFSSTETVFSAIVSSQDAESFLVLDDNSIDIFDSLPSSPTGSIGGWMSPDVRSIRSQTSGTVTPRRAMSVDSSWTRRPAPVSVPPLPIPIPNSPPPYSPDAVNDDNNNDNRDSVNSTSHVYEESRITFQPGVHGSREHAPNSSSGRRSRSKPTRSAPQEPLPPLPPLPHPYASNPTTSRPHMVARGPLVSSDFIASPSPVTSPPVEEEEEGPSPTGIDAYEYAQAHARAHAQTQITPTPSMYFRSQYTPSTHAHNDETEELSRGRKKSRFSLAALGSRLVKAVRSRSRSKSKGPTKDVTTQAHRDPSQSSYSSRPSSSGVSTRSGVSGISGSSAASIATTNTTDSKKRRSLSLPWKRKRKTTTVDMEEEEGRGRVRERMSTSSRPGEAELGVLDISSSSTPRSNNSINSHSAASSFASPPPSIRTDRRASSSSRSIADSQAPSHISFAPSSFRTPSPSPRSPTNSGANENPRWKDFAKGTSSHQKPLSSLSDTYLPQSTLRWQLKASVHRPGAFASKMQVTQEVLVVSGPGEDDGEDGVNGETVVVERTWDGGVPLLHANPNPGSLQYLIAISGRCFCIGGVIPIELTLMPLDKVRVHRLGVTLEQKIEYHTQFKRVARTDPVLSIPLLSVKEEKYQSKEKVKELKHILPLESDDPEALRKSPLWDVMKRSLLERMRESEVEEERKRDDDEDDLSYDSDASQPQSRIFP